MKCLKCKKSAVFLSPQYCESHFVSYFEKKVSSTIRRFNLFKRTDKIAVAVSGGKDSMSLLFLLKKLRYKVAALAVDEGIQGYRDKTLAHMKGFCLKNKIPYKIVSFKKEFGISLDRIAKTNKFLPCSVCGVFRRKLLNKYSNSFDILATAHNMDDEAQAIIMNLTKNNLPLLVRLGPTSGKIRNKKFTKRVKPFYLCGEKEIMAYSFLNNLNKEYGECPYVTSSFRLKIRDAINETEYKKPGKKNKIVSSFLSLHLKAVKDNNTYCVLCGDPSSRDICTACAFSKSIGATII